MNPFQKAASLFFIALLLAAGCKKPAASPGTVDSALLGTWVASNGGSEYNLKLDSSQHYVYTESNTELETGTYALSGSNISFITATSQVQCISITGLYNYKITGSALKLARITDSCVYRSTLMAYTWTRK